MASSVFCFYLTYGSSGCAVTKINQERDDALILQMPKKTHLSSDSRNQVAVGCVVIKDVTYCKNLLKKANSTLWRR